MKEHDMISMDVRSNRGVRMTPAQFARDECANMLPDGACLGMKVESLLDSGQPKTCSPRNRCRVADGKRCDYFERVILPLANQPSPKSAPDLQARRASARDAYLGMNAMARSTVKANVRPCPTCGNPRLPRHRLCESCGAAQRREKGRNRIRQHRTRNSPEPVTL
jgi:ribosomal protein L32